MNPFKITDIEWKELPLHPEIFNGYQISIKCLVTFENKPSLDDKYDDNFSFTLIALDDEGYAVLEVEFYGYSYPQNKKSRIVTQRFSCEMQESDIISSWVLK